MLKPYVMQHMERGDLAKATCVFNSSIDAPLEVELTITARDSYGQQSPLPHTLEHRVDECIFEVRGSFSK